MERRMSRYLVVALLVGCGSIEGPSRPSGPTTSDGPVPGSSTTESANNASVNSTSTTIPGTTVGGPLPTTNGNTVPPDRDRPPRNNTNGNPPNTNNPPPDNMGDPPVGGDTDEPVAIDRGPDVDTPGSYKGLPLSLTDNGSPTVTSMGGKIGVVCVGMSNGNRECDDYIDKIARTWSADINSEVVVVNCAVGGNAIEKWSDPANDGVLWDSCKNSKIGAAGLTVDQVRVVWHKAANQFTTMGQGMARPFYPDAESDYLVFYDNLTNFAGRVAQQFPNVQAVYSSSRSYGGFSDRIDRGEPLSYEEGHALNTWLGDNPSVDGVWYGWGPYIWAPDCATGDTNRSGVCYERSDYEGDAIHPAGGARDKISQMLHDRFSTESWYQP